MHDATTQNQDIKESPYQGMDPDLFIEYDSEPTGVWTIEDLQELLGWAVENRMSDMILSTNEPIWLSRLGLKIPITKRKLNVQEVDALIDATARNHSASSSLKSGVEKNYAYEFRYNRDKSYRFRVNATSSLLRNSTGSVMTMRHIPDFPPSLDEQKLDPELRCALQPKDGFVLVSGNTGTGKTTLVGGIIREILEGIGKSIVTYEDPVEYIFKELAGRRCLIDHHEIGNNLQGWVDAPPNANRRDPDIVFLGEAKEKATMAGLLDLGNIGKACYATLHTSRVRSVIPRILDRFDHAEKAQMATTLIMNLRVLISQRLLLHADQKRRVAIREYLVVKARHRDALMETPIEKMPLLMDRFVNEDGCSFLKAAKKLFEEGEILKDAYDQICLEME